MVLRNGKIFSVSAVGLALLLQCPLSAAQAADAVADVQPASKSAPTATGASQNAVDAAIQSAVKPLTEAAAPDSGDKANATGGATKFLIKPGQPISVTMEQEDLVPTDDVALATKQAIAYPESPEASFILAVALTRTSRIEEALREVRRARRLAEKQGGASYFDKMIGQYEKMLEYCPDENRVRYGLAWAYYMKAYLLTNGHPAVKPVLPGALTAVPGSAATIAAPQNISINIQQGKNQNWADAARAGMVLAALNPKLAAAIPNVPGAVPGKSLPQFKGALENASPDAVPQIKKYYSAALKNLDDLLARNPKDVWAKVYRAFLYTEYTGDLNSSMEVWKTCKAESPNNPAPYFFLGQGYLKQGNLKESLNYISRAIALRATGN